jgi:hypothetical protein
MNVVFLSATRRVVRRIAVILILAIGLAGVVGANRLAGDWHYVLSAPPGELLYVAAFDGFNEDWQQYDGRLSAQIADSVMRISVGDVNAGPYSAASPYFGDFDLTVTGRAVEGPEDNGYGVIFRMRDRFNFYAFFVSSDGYYRVLRVVNGDERELSTWIDSPTVAPGLGAVNTLRVAARGDQFEFYANGERLAVCIPNDPGARSTYYLDTCLEGQMLDTLTDSTFPSGQLGVVAQAFAQPDVVVEFDNVVVYSPA